MRLGNRAIQVAKAALYGYLFVFVVAVSAVVVASTVALVAGVSSLDVGIGPIPLMSFWNSGAGYGFQSQWGVGALACFGALAGAALGIRRQPHRVGLDR
jgi:hypothetical protein